jgi:hypothetical protein
MTTTKERVKYFQYETDGTTTFSSVNIHNVGWKLKIIKLERWNACDVQNI